MTSPFSFCRVKYSTVKRKPAVLYRKPLPSLCVKLSIRGTAANFYGDRLPFAWWRSGATSRSDKQPVLVPPRAKRRSRSLRVATDAMEEAFHWMAACMAGATMCLLPLTSPAVWAAPCCIVQPAHGFVSANRPHAIITGAKKLSTHLPWVASRKSALCAGFLAHHTRGGLISPT